MSTNNLKYPISVVTNPLKGPDGSPVTIGTIRLEPLAFNEMSPYIAFRLAEPPLGVDLCGNEYPTPAPIEILKLGILQLAEPNGPFAHIVRWVLYAKHPDIKKLIHIPGFRPYDSYKNYEPGAWDQWQRTVAESEVKTQWRKLFHSIKTDKT